MKKILIILLSCAFLMGLTACSTSQVVIDGAYTVKKATVEKAFADATPGENNAFIVVRVSTPKGNIDKLQEAFFSAVNEKSNISDGVNSYECAFLVLDEKGDEINAALVYEVPSNFDLSKAATLSGGDFTPTAITVK